MEIDSLINNLLNELKDKIEINRVDSRFNDEVFFYSFSTNLKTTSDRISNGYGYSFNSKKLALLKSLAEAYERHCNYIFDGKNTIKGSYSELSKTVKLLNSDCFKRGFKNEILTWSEAKSLFTKSKIYIPSQQIYLSNLIKEKPLTSRISTGCAAGSSHKDTLLRCIYEIIERDAFMCWYLYKLPAKEILISKLNNKNIQEIFKKSYDFKLDLKVFDITQDIPIPTFLVVIIDKTGIGPAITVGCKSGFNKIKTLTSTIEECFAMRTTRRIRFNNLRINNINNTTERMTYWYPTSSIKLLNFLFNSKKINLTINSYKNEYEQVLKILNNKKLDIFYKNISQIKKLDKKIIVYKAIIPKLQPLWQDEKMFELKINRKNDLEKYYNFKIKKINKYPHPLT